MPLMVLSVVSPLEQLFGLVFVIFLQLLEITAIVLWIYIMFKAYNGERYELPIIAEIVDDHLMI
jgi:uncharacterized membrane protein